MRRIYLLFFIQRLSYTDYVINKLNHNNKVYYAKVLVLKSSILADYSHTNKMADYFIGQWRKNHADDAITVRNLSAEPVPVLDNEIVSGMHGSAGGTLTQRQESANALQTELIDELLHTTLSYSPHQCITSPYRHS